MVTALLIAAALFAATVSPVVPTDVESYTLLALTALRPMLLDTSEQECECISTKVLVLVLASDPLLDRLLCILTDSACILLVSSCRLADSSHPQADSSHPQADSSHPQADSSHPQVCKCSTPGEGGCVADPRTYRSAARRHSGAH